MLSIFPMLYYSNLQGRAVAKLANVAHRKHHSKLNRAVVTYLWPMSLFPPPFLLFSSSQPVFSLPFFFSLFWNWLSSTITKTLGSDWLTGNRRGRAQCDWGGVGSADRPGEKHDVRNAVLQSMRDHFWLEGSVAKKLAGSIPVLREMVCNPNRETRHM